MLSVLVLPSPRTDIIVTDTEPHRRSRHTSCDVSQLSGIDLADQRNANPGLTSALSRRVPQSDEAPSVKLGRVTVDLVAHSVVSHTTQGAKQIRLTPTEWQVLELLIRNAGRLVTRQTLLTSIWGSNHVQDTGYLRLYISQLRKKIEEDPAHPKHILTEPGMGYRLEGYEAPK